MDPTTIQPILNALAGVFGGPWGYVILGVGMWYLTKRGFIKPKTPAPTPADPLAPTPPPTLADRLDALLDIWRRLKAKEGSGSEVSAKYVGFLRGKLDEIEGEIYAKADRLTADLLAPPAPKT